MKIIKNSDAACLAVGLNALPADLTADQEARLATLIDPLLSIYGPEIPGAFVGVYVYAPVAEDDIDAFGLALNSGDQWAFVISSAVLDLTAAELKLIVGYGIIDTVEHGLEVSVDVQAAYAAAQEEAE